MVRGCSWGCGWRVTTAKGAGCGLGSARLRRREEEEEEEEDMVDGGLDVGERVPAVGCYANVIMRAAG